MWIRGVSSDSWGARLVLVLAGRGDWLRILVGRVEITVFMVRAGARTNTGTRMFHPRKTEQIRSGAITEYSAQITDLSQYSAATRTIARPAHGTNQTTCYPEALCL